MLRFGAAPPTSTVEELRALPVGPASTLDDGRRRRRRSTGPQQVTRIDGERSVTVTGTATGSQPRRDHARSCRSKLDALDAAGGATLHRSAASARTRQEAFGDLGLAVLAAIAIVFLIMVATFRSLVQPLILLVSIPFAATGAIGLLLATGTPLGVPALIGVLMLVGIVVTNAIVLLDLINQYRAQGMGVREAVVEGGRRRLRPILMTAVATIFALLPMALGLTGEGGFISQPLAVVVIGGLLSSTLLTLVLVPTLYTMVEHTKESLRERRAAWRRAARPATGPTAPGDRRSRSTEPARRCRLARRPDAGRGAQTPPARPAPSAALVDGTDQFEVLRLPKSRTSPLPPTESTE